MRPGGGGLFLGWGLICLGTSIAAAGIELRLRAVALTGGCVWCLGAATQMAAIARRGRLLIRG